MSREIEQFVTEGELLPRKEPAQDAREMFTSKIEELLRGLKPEVEVTREDGMETLVQSTTRKFVVSGGVLLEMDQEMRDFVQNHQQGPFADDLPLEVAQSEMLVRYKSKREMDILREAGFTMVTILDGNKSKEYASFGREVSAKISSPLMGLSSSDGNPIFSWTYELKQPYSGSPLVETDFQSFYDLPNSLRFTGSHVSGGAKDSNFTSFTVLLNNARGQSKEIGIKPHSSR